MKPTDKPSSIAVTEQKKFKLDFNLPNLTLDGVELEEISPSFRGAYADLQPSDYVKSKLNKILARSIANSNEDLDGREFEWYSVLYTKGILELDEVGTRKLKQYITNKRKGEGAFSNIVVKQLFDVFTRANFTE
jgi:hypothetical protein